VIDWPENFFKSVELTDEGLLKAKFLRKIGSGPTAKYIYKEPTEKEHIDKLFDEYKNSPMSNGDSKKIKPSGSIYKDHQNILMGEKGSVEIDKWFKFDSPANKPSMLKLKNKGSSILVHIFLEKNKLATIKISKNDKVEKHVYHR